MSSPSLLDDLVLTPFPVIVVMTIALLRSVATSGTSIDPRPRWHKWPAYAAIVWGAGLALGLYIDILDVMRFGWPHDGLKDLSLPIAYSLIFATLAGLAMVALWGLGLLLKVIFPGLEFCGKDDDWDITAGL